MKPKELSLLDKTVIKEYASGNNNSLREEAINIYRRLIALPEGVVECPEIKFMAEVDNNYPDLTLRAKYRKELRDASS